MSHWNDFYQQSGGRGLSPLLTRAMRLAPQHPGVPQAIDLGCGAGHEARQLVEAGWQVLAVDNEPQAIARTTATCAQVHATRLVTWLTSFEQLPDLPHASLIHAGLSLPFCRPERFQHLWRQLTRALIPGGVFAGHFFGPRHGWSTFEHLSFHAEHDIHRLCAGMEIELLRETESLIDKPAGQLNWHRFDLIVRKSGLLR